MTKSFNLAIKGTLVLPDRVVENGTIGVADGKITGIFEPGAAVNAAETLDATGRLVFPGIIDPHVHSLSNPAEGVAAASAGAAVGGVTTIIEMPYDTAGAINQPDRLAAKVALVERETHVDTALLATLPKQAVKEQIEPMLRDGPCGIKLSVYETDPNRFPRMDDEVLWDILPEMARLGVVTGFHAENEAVITHLVRRYKEQGHTEARYHCLCRPPATESLAVVKLLEFAWQSRFPLHIHHVADPHSLDIVNWYKEHGLTNVSTETCPHYLALSEEDMDRLGYLGKINPPLRSRAIVEKLWEHVASGGVDMIGSDHAPWHEGSKTDLFSGPCGAPGLETMFSVMYTEGVVRRELPLTRLAEMMSANPARRFGFGDRKGRIETGLDADFAIVDPAGEWEFDPANSHSYAKWSPFAGRKLRGRVVKTILRGKTIAENGKLLVSPGNGKYLPVDYPRKM